MAIVYPWTFIGDLEIKEDEGGAQAPALEAPMKSAKRASQSAMHLLISFDIAGGPAKLPRKGPIFNAQELALGYQLHTSNPSRRFRHRSKANAESARKEPATKQPLLSSSRVQVLLLGVFFPVSPGQSFEKCF